MKRRIDVEGHEPILLDLRRSNNSVSYALTGGETKSGTASIIEVAPGLFSVILDDNRSIAVRVSRSPDGLHVLAGDSLVRLTVADARDALTSSSAGQRTGPTEVRALMPGKVLRVLVVPDMQVEAGAPLLVIEAMKMQNEMKAPKAGKVLRVQAEEGASVAAGASLVVID